MSKSGDLAILAKGGDLAILAILAVLAKIGGEHEENDDDGEGDKDKSIKSEDKLAEFLSKDELLTKEVFLLVVSSFFSSR